MSSSDVERTHIREGEVARLEARDEVHKKPYGRLIAVGLTWAAALVTLALTVGG